MLGRPSCGAPGHCQGNVLPLSSRASLGYDPIAPYDGALPHLNAGLSGENGARCQLSENCHPERSEGPLKATD